MHVRAQNNAHEKSEQFIDIAEPAKFFRSINSRNRVQLFDISTKIGKYTLNEESIECAENMLEAIRIRVAVAATDASMSRNALPIHQIVLTKSNDEEHNRGVINSE